MNYILKDEINNVWNCDILLYNISITVGISFDILHFDNIFCFVHSVNMRDFFQSTARVRKIQSNELNIYLLDKKQPYDSNLKNIDITNNILFTKYEKEIYNDIVNNKNENIMNKLIDIRNNNNNISVNDFFNSLINSIPDGLKNVRFRTIIENKLI